MGGHIFINYRSKDSDVYVAMLYEELSRRFGDDEVFRDVDSIQAGADFPEVLICQVRTARAVLAVIGPGWFAALGPDGRRALDNPEDWTRRELAEAFDEGVRVIPVLIDGATMPAVAGLPADIAELAGRQGRPLSSRRQRVDLARIVRDLRPRRPLRRIAVIAAAAALALTGGGLVTAATLDKPAASTPKSILGEQWHTNEANRQCPAQNALCFYEDTRHLRFLGWYTPVSCTQTLPIPWPGRVASIRNHTGCTVVLMYCPNECRTERIAPGAHPDTIELRGLVDRVKLGL
jgi:hypothetical protein